jgi:sugar lactone lactonase YvrE
MWLHRWLDSLLSTSGPGCTDLRRRPRLEVELLEDRLAPNDLLGTATGWSWLGRLLDLPDGIPAEAAIVDERPTSARPARAGRPSARDTEDPQSAPTSAAFLGNSSALPAASSTAGPQHRDQEANAGTDFHGSQADLLYDLPDLTSRGSGRQLPAHDEALSIATAAGGVSSEASPPGSAASGNVGPGVVMPGRQAPVSPLLGQGASNPSAGQPPVVLGPSAAVTFPSGFGIHGVGGDEVLLFGVQPSPGAQEPTGVHVASRLSGQVLAEVTPPPSGWQTPLAIKITDFQRQGQRTQGTFLLLDAGVPPEQAGTRPAVVYRYDYSFSPQEGYRDHRLETHVLPLAGPPGPGLPTGIVFPESLGLLPGGNVAVTDTLGGAIWVAGPSLEDWHLALIDPRLAPGFGAPEIDGIGRAPGGGTQSYRLLLPTPPGAPGPAAPGVHSIAYAAVTDEVYFNRTATPGGIYGIPRSVLLDTTTPPFAKGDAMRVLVPPAAGLSDLTDGLDYDRFHPTTPWLYWQRAPSDAIGGGFNTLRRVNLFTGEVQVVAQSNTLFDFTNEISALPGLGDSPFTSIASAMGQEENNPDINVLLGGVSTYVAPTLITVTGVSNGGDRTEDGGQLYVSTVGDNSIHRINPAGMVHPFTTSGLNAPVLMDFDHHGNLYVANFYGNTISKITPNGQATTFASVNAPIGVQFDAHGVLYVSSPFINTISKVSADGTVTPFVTSGLIQPLAMVFDHSGNMYVTNFGVGPPNKPTPGAGFVTKITPDGMVSTIVAGLTGPTGLVFDRAGILYVASDISRIDKISPDGTMTPFVSSGLNIPADMTFGPDGVLYVANEGGGSISKVTPDGMVSTWITGLLIPQDVAFRPRIDGD